jgi:predicted nuclease of predicted toxin-antitoxin system
MPSICLRPSQSLHPAGRVKFLVDAQLPPALARALREAGYDAQAVREVGLREADDGAIWRHALIHRDIIVTKDQDFADRSLYDETAPTIVWLRIGNTSNRSLLELLLPLWPEVASRVQSGEKVIEVREKRTS